MTNGKKPSDHKVRDNERKSEDPQRIEKKDGGRVIRDSEPPPERPKKTK